MALHASLQRSIVVIGASAGGIEALLELVGQLPSNFEAAVFVALHLAADSPGTLPAILSNAGSLPANHAADGAPIVSGRIYVAPADHHLLLERGRMRITRGPKENRFRPAIDPLFRTAAYAYGSQVIGIVLSGSLDDGAAGLWAIKDRGGLAVVQDPTEAAYPSMPLHALKYVQVDYRLGAAEIGKLLPRLVGEPLRASVGAEGEAPVSDKLEIEAKIAMGDQPIQAGVMQLGPLTPYTCPECSGVLMQLQDGNLLRFRCHTGHAYSMGSLLAAINESIEQTLWGTVRVLEEHMLLLQHLSRHAGESEDQDLTRRLSFKAQTAEDKVQIVRQLALRQGSEDGDL